MDGNSCSKIVGERLQGVWVIADCGLIEHQA